MISKCNLQSSSKVLEVLHQLLHVLQRNRIVVAGAHAAYTAVTLEALKKTLLSASDERLLLCVIAAANAEADVHAAANAGVRNNLVHCRVLVQSTVDELGLLVGDFLLTADLLGAELVQQVGHDLAGDPEVEDGESVVKGVVLCNGSVVEDNWAGETADVQSVKESRGRSGGLGREEVLANDGNGDTGNTDILLCATLYITLMHCSHRADILKLLTKITAYLLTSTFRLMKLELISATTRRSSSAS
jgi:hypothetical protein